MSILNHSLLLGAAAGGGGTYQISRSLRFNSADSAYLSRTPASAGNRKTWTWAGWVKRSALGTTGMLFGAGNIDTTQTRIGFNSADILQVDDFSSGYQFQLNSTAVFRDASAWYHIQVAVDTTQATASNRIKVYVNGSQLTSFTTATYCTQNYDGQVNTASLPHRIGVVAGTTAGSFSYYFPGYLADIHFIDGQALDPTSFGEFDANGIWQPKAYSGSYGTNGFRLDFADNASTTTIGYDAAGSNDWTANNLSVTAGSGNDSLVDSPTSYGTDTGAGGEVRGNYCTLNPLDNGGLTLANGNLDASRSTASWVTTRHTIGMSSGKWYWEVTCNASTTGNGLMLGIINAAGSLSTFVGNNSGGYGYNWDATKYNNGFGVGYGATFTSGDVISVAFDADAGSLTFYKNGSSQGVAYSSILAGTYFPATSMTGTMSASINHGQRPFAYTAPSGYKALCSTNLPTPTILNGATAMDVVTYTGTGATLTPTSSLGFSPDLVWIKSRSAATDNTLYDNVRGAQARLESNNGDTEVTTDGGLTAFNSNGLTLGTLAQVNTLNATYAAWCWDAGSSTVTNTAGTIQSTVRANPAAGFSIVTWTGNGVNGSTVGHGLNTAIQFLIVKNRDTINNWCCYHIGLTSAAYYITLNTTGGQANNVSCWNNTPPTSTVFSLGTATAGDVNTSGTKCLAYCFAPVSGYSAFGSYTGNGSADGPFVYTGFRPRWVMVKRADVADEWTILDSNRSSYNEAKLELYPSSSASEGANGGPVDINSNGFKMRTTRAVWNASSGTYIYAAFAENPFSISRAR